MCSILMLKQGNYWVDDYGSLVVENNGSLDCALVLHGLQALSPLVELEGLIDDPFDLDLARVEIVNGSSLETSALSRRRWILEEKSRLTEHVGLGERSKDCDLITKDLAGWPRNTSSGGVHTMRISKLVLHPIRHVWWNNLEYGITHP